MATLTADTVQNILQVISDWRGESTTNTDASRIRAISRAEQDFALRKFWRVHLLRDQTMAGTGANDYTIGSSTYPMRMKGLEELFFGGTTEDKRVQVYDFNDYKVLYNANNAARIAYEWYDATNDLWKVHINPAPASTDTITYSYFWQPPKRTATADMVVCPDIEIIAHLALAEIYDAEDETQKALLERKYAEDKITEISGKEEAPAVNQLYQVPAIENSVKNRGLGNY